MPAGSTGPVEVIDAQAKAAYRRRLEDLEDEMSEARAFGDAERAARAEEEREAIARELAAAFGLSGRKRRTGSAGERARVAVTQAIRTALGKINEQSHSLGEHRSHDLHRDLLLLRAGSPRSHQVAATSEGSKDERPADPALQA